MTDYFPLCVLKETNDLVTVKEEMDFVKSYLNIQRFVFPTDPTVPTPWRRKRKTRRSRRC